MIRTWLCISTLAAAAAAQADIVPMFLFENQGNVPGAGLGLNIELIPQGSAVDVVFRNDSTAPSVITALYLESTAASTAMLSNPVIMPAPDGINFEGPAIPHNPPGSIQHSGGPWGGNLFSARSIAPRPHNGIGPGEFLTIRFDLDGTVPGLEAAIRDGEIRLVEHVQGMGEHSGWAVTIPSPSAAALGVVAVAVAGRRRR